MQTVQETSYGDLSIVDAEDDERLQALFVGGWNQNPNFMVGLQETMAREYGISSIGFSGFDTIPTTLEASPVFDKSKDPLLANIPDRMIIRANILNRLSMSALHDRMDPSVVLTHCAGANVFLLARYLQQVNVEEGTLPDRGVLAEPMIYQAADLQIRHYTRGWLTHEKQAKQDPSLISLEEMAGDEPMDAKRGTPALKDIASSYGATLLKSALEEGAELEVVVGQNDHASDLSALVEGFTAEGLQVPILAYPDQSRTGHGYLLVKPSEALRFIAPILLQSA